MKARPTVHEATRKQAELDACAATFGPPVPEADRVPTLRWALPSRAASYPHAAGWKGPAETGEDAALATDAETLRARVLDALQHGPLSADEVADALHADILAIRPRVSELRALGQVEDTGQRAYNRSGHRAIVWRRVTGVQHDG